MVIVEILVAASQGKNNWKTSWPRGTLGHTTQAAGQVFYLCQQVKPLSNSIRSNAVTRRSEHRLRLHGRWLRHPSSVGFFLPVNAALSQILLLLLPNPLPTIQFNFCFFKYHYAFSLVSCRTFNIPLGYFVLSHNCVNCFFCESCN